VEQQAAGGGAPRTDRERLDPEVLVEHDEVWPAADE
jgi:hypothetical protein